MNIKQLKTNIMKEAQVFIDTRTAKYGNFKITSTATGFTIYLKCDKSSKLINKALELGHGVNKLSYVDMENLKKMSYATEKGSPWACNDLMYDKEYNSK